ncbi:MAG: hypothetical protein ABWX61_01590 [Paenisporosarcina sp.]
MKWRYVLILCIVFSILFFIQPKEHLLSVFRVTDEPDVIASGSNGMTLTVDVSFGREDVEEWITNLESPYPLLFLEADWIERSPKIVNLIIEKKIPVGLLGSNGEMYLENPDLLTKEIKKFELAFENKPLWFRTADYEFPAELKEKVWDYEMNLVSASVFWTTGDFPKIIKGDIVSATLHQEQRVSLKKLKAFQKAYPFQTIEETLFSFKTNTKTFP